MHVIVLLKFLLNMSYKIWKKLMLMITYNDCPK